MVGFFGETGARLHVTEVFALRGTPASPNQSEKVAVDIRTESEHGRTHHVHFNRGAAASQEYTRRFGDKRAEEIGPAAFTWLSRGAAESIANFIERATGPGWELHVAAYEFTDDKVLTALGAARDRGVDVQVLYHAKNDEQKIANEAAIQKFGLGNICYPRNAQGLTLSRNKTIVLRRPAPLKPCSQVRRISVSEESLAIATSSYL